LTVFTKYSPPFTTDTKYYCSVGFERYRYWVIGNSAIFAYIG